MKFTVLILLFLTKVISAQPLKNEIINVERNDTLYLSNITEDVKCYRLIPHHDYNIFEIQKVVVTDSFIFVLTPKSLTDLGSYVLLKFNKTGEFVKKISCFNTERNEFGRIRDIQYLNSTNNLLLFLDNGYKITNQDDYLIHENNRKFQSNPIYFENELYFYNYNFSNNKPNLFLIKTGLSNIKNDTIFSIYPQDFGHKSTCIFRPVNFSKSNGDLYFSVGYDNTIYQFSDHKLTQFIKFEFKNCNPARLKVTLAPKQVIIGDYCQFGYCLRGNPDKQYIYIYNIKTGKSYNLQLKGTYNNLESGITDDVFDSGYIQLTPLNKEGYSYFVKKGYLDETQNKPNISYTLFIAKLK